MSETWECIAYLSAWCWTGPNKNGSYSGVLMRGDVVTVTEKSGSWLKHSKGWTSQYDKDGTPLMKLKSAAKPVTTNPPVVKDYTTVPPSMTAYTPDLEEYRVLMDDDEYLSSLDGELRIKNLRGIHGMPYQFTSAVDARIGSASDSIGRKYGEKIVAQMPLLLMTPGTPVFLSKYNTKQKKNFLAGILGMMSGSGESELNNLLEWEGKYYSLKFDYVQYYKYVNPMCRTMARFLGIHNETVDGIPLDRYGWDQNTNESIHGGGMSFDTLKNIQKIVAYRGCVPFYIESENQISDSFSNGTAESPLAGKINSISDMGRELNFILGKTDATLGTNFDALIGQENLAQNQENVQDFINKALGSGSIFESLASSIQTVAAGGRLIFPEIWSDSSYMKSYNITLKLISNDPDPFSWFMNIGQSLCHLMGFVIPRQVDSNGYISPFIVKAFYKGFFNIDMGIITDMSFNKGAEGCWTAQGLPTVVDVNFSIKDLYSIMGMTSNDKVKYNIMNNIMELDYIANLCGVNINEPDVGRMINMYFTQNVENRITDAVRLNVFGKLEQAVSNGMMKILLGQI